MKTYEAKPSLVDAEQFTDPKAPPAGVDVLKLQPLVGIIVVRRENVAVNEGDWVEYDENGPRAVWPDEVFRSKYIVEDDEAEVEPAAD